MKRDTPPVDISWPGLVLPWAGWPLVRCAPQPPIRGISLPSLVLHGEDLPQAETSCGHVCDNIGHIDQMYPHPLVETSHGQVWYCCEQADLHSEVPPHMKHQARFAFSQMSGQVNINVRCTPLNEKVIWTRKDDWPPWMTSTPQRTFYPGG